MILFASCRSVLRIWTQPLHRAPVAGCSRNDEGQDPMGLSRKAARDQRMMPAWRQSLCAHAQMLCLKQESRSGSH